MLPMGGGGDDFSSVPPLSLPQEGQQQFLNSAGQQQLPFLGSAYQSFQWQNFELFQGRDGIVQPSGKANKLKLELLLMFCYVFGHPGSGFGSISTRYVSGSFYNQAKIVRKKP
jgi:hypothetical protein